MCIFPFCCILHIKSTKRLIIVLSIYYLDYAQYMHIFVKTEINFFLYALQIFLLAFGNHSHLFTQPVYVHMWTSWTFQSYSTLFLLFLLHRVWKDEKFTEKKFRQINYLLISLVFNTVTFTKFFPKMMRDSVRVNFFRNLCSSSITIQIVVLSPLISSLKNTIPNLCKSKK